MKRLNKVVCLLVAGVLVSTVAPAAGKVITPGAPAISVTRGPSGSVIVDVKDSTVAIHKVLKPGSSVTTMGSGATKVVFTIEGQSVVINAAGKVARGNMSQPKTLTDVFNLLQASATTAKAKRLLDRTTLQADSLQGNTLLLTRALLGSLVGDEASAREYQRWVTSKVSQKKVVRVGFQDEFDRLPGECWNEYAKEAIRIQKDLEECVKDCGAPRLGWCQAGCGLIYEVRAEAAMMWFMRCSGGFFVG